jgi:hypothetical protein
MTPIKIRAIKECYRCVIAINVSENMNALIP